jgi:DNA-binding beta-propeller fold protein YncE
MRPVTRSAQVIPALCLALGLGTSQALAAPIYSLTTLLSVPASPDNNTGGKFTSYDIGDFDGTTQNYYLADRSNASVDIYSAATNSFVGRIGGTGNLFVGVQPPPPASIDNNISGPNGVIPVELSGQHLLYAGDGNSTLKGFNLSNSNAPLPGTPIVTGAPTDQRANEGAYSPQNQRLLIANSAAATPYVSLIDPTTNTVVAKTFLDGTNGAPRATAGLESSTWDPSTNRFYLAIPEINGSGPGAVVAIDPLTGAVTKTFDLQTFGFSSCAPTGLAHGSGSQLLVGCDAGQSIVLDTTANGGNGSVTSIPQVFGSDEVRYDPVTNLYFLAARNNGTGPVLGIIDGATNTFLQSLPTVPNGHSVAVDPVSGEVFVPFGGVAGNTVCPNGCIAVFSASAANVPEPGAFPLLAAGLFGFAGLAWRRRCLS